MAGSSGDGAGLAGLPRHAKRIGVTPTEIKKIDNLT
jgi:hypothetical protein